MHAQAHTHTCCQTVLMSNPCQTAWLIIKLTDGWISPVYLQLFCSCHSQQQGLYPAPRPPAALGERLHAPSSPHITSQLNTHSPTLKGDTINTSTFVFSISLMFWSSTYLPRTLMLLLNQSPKYHYISMRTTAKTWQNIYRKARSLVWGLFWHCFDKFWWRH